MNYSLAEAFERNRGLISKDEQERLANSLVVIPGCGGVGGMHAHTLARLGVGRFRLTDPDTFSIANINRQIGATVHNVDKNKAVVTAEMVKSINPTAEVSIIEGGLTPGNCKEFVAGSDLVVDGIDFFSFSHRRMLFQEAWNQRVPALTAAPLGFSGTLHIFAPGGMSFDEYFDLRDEQSPFDQFINFFMGLAPARLHVPYMDLSSIEPATGRGPSSIIGSQLAACLVGTEAVRLLLNRGPSALAPYYLQVDLYRQRLVKAKLWKGNRNPLQRLRKRLFVKRLRELGLDKAFQEAAGG